ncbi:IclR family transcriptional regulator [Geomonas sp.]|uniref:IclR family transcriptional regulator n=1 Tax=Geomonas sp. TaxID=2651584 RepID=UPI002B475FCD|nr:IclR family transcriptional regulator [Geomonas sp.]HJV37098.1 IclR family transcriptional regulator [Geomonas sp.]
MLKRKKDVSSKDLRKAVELLEILATSGGERGSVSALSRAAGISRYKATRLMNMLEKKGLVERVLLTGDAGCARRLVEELVEGSGSSSLALSGTDAPPAPVNDELHGIIISDVRPVLESLARRHNEAIYMVIPNGEEVLFLDMVDCGQPERVEPVVGRRLPFFSNAAGKVMRAIDSWDLLERIGRRWGRSRGRGRYPDLAVLRAELEQIREKGVAVDSGGMGEGVITVAVAIRDYAGKVVGALMMLGPSFRLFGERLEAEIIPSLRLSAESLSMQFGYARP